MNPSTRKSAHLYHKNFESIYRDMFHAYHRSRIGLIHQGVNTYEIAELVKDVINGYLTHLETGENDQKSYLVARYLNFITRGVAGSIFHLSSLCAMHNRNGCITKKRYYNNYHEIRSIEDLICNGYLEICPEAIGVDVNTIKSLCDNLWITPSGIEHRKIKSSDIHSDLGKKSFIWTIGHADLIKIRPVVELALNQTILNIAQGYLGSDHVYVKSIDAWWKTPNRPEDYSKTADFFHRDCDQNRWLNMFLFMTPVSRNNGCHVFIKHTHHRGGFDGFLYADRRYGDHELDAEYKNNMKYFESEKPLIVLEDTWGFHRATECLSPRFVLQIRYSTTMYGAPVGLQPKDTKKLLSYLNSDLCIGWEKLKALAPLLSGKLPAEVLTLQ
jgi:hypothetical protein